MKIVENLKYACNIQTLLLKDGTYIGEFSQTLFNFKKLIQDKNTPMHFTLAQVAMQEIKNDE